MVWKIAIYLSALGSFVKKNLQRGNDQARSNENASRSGVVVLLLQRINHSFKSANLAVSYKCQKRLHLSYCSIFILPLPDQIQIFIKITFPAIVDEDVRRLHDGYKAAGWRLMREYEY
mmetsp:Transcript_15431/g.33561  ORF Transcript_15431/g.33561 Transcript_15431/m.33561 type:complete len:118 (-) Transcript_15431:223-576(-)